MTARLFLLFLILLLASVAKARVDNPLTSAWTGPSTSQTFTASDSTIESFVIRKASFPIFLLALGFGTLCFMPFVCCFRYCCQCCGSSNMRPGHLCCGGAELDYLDENTKMRRYERRDVLCNRFTTYGALVLALVFIIMAMVGASRLAAIPSNVGKGIVRTSDWILGIMQKLIEAVVDSSASGFVVNSASASTASYVDGFNYNAFASVKSALQTARDKANDAADASKIAFTVPAAIGYVLAVPVAVIGVGVIAAFCNCRICLPYLTIATASLMQFVAFSLACLVLLVLIPIHVLCDEVDAQISKTPGLFQWYVLPQCEVTSFTSDMSNAMETAERNLGTSACNGALSACNYTSSSGARYLQCDPTKVASCVTASDALDLIGSSIVVTTNACGSSASSCTVAECAQTCTDVSLKATSEATMKGIRIGQRVLYAIQTYLLPNIKCNPLLDRLMDTAPLPLCNDLRGGLTLLAAAAIIAGITLLTTIVVMFRGQKRFFDYDKVPPAPPAAAADGLNLNSMGMPLMPYPPYQQQQVYPQQPYQEMAMMSSGNASPSPYYTPSVADLYTPAPLPPAVNPAYMAPQQSYGDQFGQQQQQQQQQSHQMAEPYQKTECDHDDL